MKAVDQLDNVLTLWFILEPSIQLQLPSCCTRAMMYSYVSQYWPFTQKFLQWPFTYSYECSGCIYSFSTTDTRRVSAKWQSVHRSKKQNYDPALLLQPEITHVLFLKSLLDLTLPIQILCGSRGDDLWLFLWLEHPLISPPTHKEERF